MEMRARAASCFVPGAAKFEPCTASLTLPIRFYLDNAASGKVPLFRHDQIKGGINGFLAFCSDQEGLEEHDGKGLFSPFGIEGEEFTGERWEPSCRDLDGDDSLFALAAERVPLQFDHGFRRRDRQPGFGRLLQGEKRERRVDWHFPAFGYQVS
ncbi:hypothetical protein H6P81_006898 [Aristolochia fimbriata]|uniref:Uncharacterized protein n=1 Tax=Aristolochia fimbriata TaxID=158543 RepID=A0AAV7EZS2_ARIFI|nr:hypothetical protein H6P81_006898 [Aristolochia fimbriata]